MEIVGHPCEPITVVSHNRWAINVVTHNTDHKVHFPNQQLKFRKTL